MLRRFSICLLIPSLFVVSVLTGVAFGRDGDSKTAGADDSLISVGVARIDVTPDGFALVECAPGVTPADIAAATGAPLPTPVAGVPAPEAVPAAEAVAP